MRLTVKRMRKATAWLRDFNTIFILRRFIPMLALELKEVNGLTAANLCLSLTIIISPYFNTTHSAREGIEGQ